MRARTSSAATSIEGDGPQFVLDLDAGLGIVRVETRNVER